MSQGPYYTKLSNQVSDQSDADRSSNIYFAPSNYMTSQYTDLEYYSENQAIEKPTGQTDAKYVVHEIQSYDTLDGLSLQYGISKIAIRNFNKLEGDNIYYLKTLKIPNPTYTGYDVSYDDAELEKMRQEDKIEQLRLLIAKDDRKAARYYLDENGWDVEKALEHYKRDLEWEKTYDKTKKNQ